LFKWFSRKCFLHSFFLMSSFHLRMNNIIIDMRSRIPIPTLIPMAIPVMIMLIINNEEFM
jgi:hypothetical protein